MLANLSKHATKVRKSLSLVKIHLEKRVRLQLDNQTRWSSSYMMLLSFHKAYLSNCFDNSACPVSHEEIEIYMQILFPAFQFSLLMQKNKSPIGDIIPTLTIMFSKWNRMEVTGRHKKFCISLVNCFKKKFDYEINSDVYKVASLLNTSKLYLWYQRSDCIDTFKSGSNSLVDVAHHFLIKNRLKPSTADNDKIKNIMDETNNDSLIGFLIDEDYENINDETFMYTNMLELNKEKLEFMKLVENKSCFNISNSKFWFHHRKELPNLTKLASILINIPSSSAFIERYYSLCGAICSQRNGNMRPETIINRCFLKTNIKLLNELNEN